jgi:hypothetical protein
LFDHDFYLSQYGDLPRSSSKAELTNHFLRYGLKEKRHGSLFHRELVSIQLNRVSVQAAIERSRRALAQFEPAAPGRADLAWRLQEHVKELSDRFESDVSGRVDWLSRLESFGL